MKNRIIELAQAQVGNGYTEYCRAFGFNYRIEWCACFISWLSMQLNMSGIVYQNMSCTQMTKWYKVQGVWHDKGDMPQPGDILFYDWNEAENDGVDHVGIVESISGTSVTVIEGNSGDTVARRIISKDYSMIYGFARPNYPTEAVSVSAPAEQTYTVQSGDTLSAIAKKYNTTYQELAQYNDISNPDVISVGQIIKIPSVTVPADPVTISPDPVTISPDPVTVPADPVIAQAPASKWDYQYDGQIAELQQILNAKGADLAVDGIAGDKTFAAVKKYTIENGDKGTLTKWVQSRLNSMGYNCGTADGIAGKNTMSGIAQFQAANSLGQGYLGGEDWYFIIK